MNRNIGAETHDTAPRTVPYKIVAVGDAAGQGSDLDWPMPDIERANTILGLVDNAGSPIAEELTRNFVTIAGLSRIMPESQAF
ncbi:MULTISPECIES: hypothetical protein [Rhizobium]|uniref:Uncharacterized protein n=1 Tax=Rhizobium rhododendri TaxID=2506430 RepID=A0ABY8IEG1_9HYPH|nr:MULTISPECIES: hypothetical protein [Rhizobium]WFS21727.1 hypothetical protein PR018_11115 [Rhizobium rhododendri]